MTLHFVDTPGWYQVHKAQPRIDHTHTHGFEPCSEPVIDGCKWLVCAVHVQDIRCQRRRIQPRRHDSNTNVIKECLFARRFGLVNTCKPGSCRKVWQHTTRTTTSQVWLPPERAVGAICSRAMRSRKTAHPVGQIRAVAGQLMLNCGRHYESRARVAVYTPRDARTAREIGYLLNYPIDLAKPDRLSLSHFLR